MNTLLRRVTAAVTALLIAGAGVLALGAPANAEPGGILWMGGTMTPTAPTDTQAIDMIVDLQSNPLSACTSGVAPTVTWDDGAGRSGTLPAPTVNSGVTLRYRANVGPFPVGTTTLTLTASGGCAQPDDDGTPPTVTTRTFTVTATPEPEPEPESEPESAWPPANDSRTISGTVQQVFDDVATPLAGVTVLLAPADGDPVVYAGYYGPTTVTDEQGRYSVSLHGDVGAPPVTVAVLLPNLAPVYYRTGASVLSGSPTDQTAATILNTESWDVGALYDVFVDLGDSPPPPPAPTGEGWAEIPVQNLTAGTPYDATFTTTIEWEWNWSNGGSIWVEGTLPVGLEAELILGEIPGWAPPSIRIHGTPERDGTVELALRAADGSKDSAIAVTFAVARPYCTEVWHSHDLFSNNVAWTSLCGRDATLGDASMAHTSQAPDAVGAFAGVGTITVNGHAVWAEEFDSYFDAQDNDWWVMTDHDVDAGAAGLVDVHVQRVVKGSTAVWFVAVYAAGTTIPVDVPLTFSGTLGTDGQPSWIGGGSFFTSSDLPGSGRPVVVHATDGILSHDGASYEISASGALTYYVGLVDYAGCAYSATMTQAASFIMGLGSNFGAEYTVAGETCVDLWEPWGDVIHVGEPFDVTIRPVVDGPLWDFGDGGTLTADVIGLVPGLQSEIVDQGLPGTAPGLHIWGTPTEVGEVGIEIEVTDGAATSGYTAVIYVTPAPTTEPDPDPDTEMTLALAAEPGDLIAGTEVTITGSGLFDPSTWDLVVRSTPQTIRSGSAGVGGTLAATATIPTGLEAGWHSLTFTGTWFTGTPAISVLWFELDGLGRLVRVSSTAPALPAAAPSGALAVTGSVPDSSHPQLALLLIVVGLAALAASSRRSRRRRPASTLAAASA